MTANGYTPVFRDYTGAPPTEGFSAWCWDDVPQEGGGHTRYVQIRAHKPIDGYDDAIDALKALLDDLATGDDEERMELPGLGYVVCECTRGPMLLDRTHQTVTAYCEVVFYCLD